MNVSLRKHREVLAGDKLRVGTWTPVHVKEGGRQTNYHQETNKTNLRNRPQCLDQKKKANKTDGRAKNRFEVKKNARPTLKTKREKNLTREEASTQKKRKKAHTCWKRRTKKGRCSAGKGPFKKRKDSWCQAKKTVPQLVCRRTRRPKLFAMKIRNVEG